MKKYWTIGLFIFTLLWLICYFNYADQPLQLFLKNWSYIPLGFCGALLGNISAVGGGIVFIPAMMFVYKLAPIVALKVAIGTQAMGMTSGAFAWYQRKLIPPFILWWTVPALLVGSFVSSYLIPANGLLVKVIFGPLSIFLGVLTIVLSRRSREDVSLTDVPLAAKYPLIVLSFLGGVLTGWVAIGEGEVIAGALIIIYGISSRFSIGLGVLLLSINSIFLAGMHFFVLDGLPMDIIVFTGLGAVFGARLAPFLAKRWSSKKLKIIFSIIAIGDGLFFVFQYFNAHQASLG